jgi:hypothetical protein
MKMILVLSAFICVHLRPISLSAQTEIIHNERVSVAEYRLSPGESRRLTTSHPSLTVYPNGEVVFDAAGKPRGLKNDGTTEARFVQIMFWGPGLDQTWGATGLSPNYKLLLENRYTRVYDIRIPAGTKEPQHTHHDRVVVCLSGAQLEHLMPDGRVEPSTLATGEIAWRRGGTHIGHNLGKTDLWVIAVEPK